MAPYTLPPRDESPFAAAEVEAYAREKDLDGLFRALMSRVFRERPSDPVDFVFAELAEHTRTARRRGMDDARAEPFPS